MLIVVLVVLNLLAAAGLLGWLGSAPRRGEADRLGEQLRPEAIRLAGEFIEPPSAAPAAVPVQAPPPVAAAAPAARPPEPPACARLEAVDDAAATEIGALAGQAGGIELSDEVTRIPTSWWVHVPPLASRAAANARVAEIRERGVKELFVLLDEGPFQYSISLGLFKNAESAELHLSRMRARGVRDGVITVRGNDVHAIELRGAAPRLEPLLERLLARFEGIERRECAR